MKPTAGLLGSPIGRRLKSTRLVPVRPELIVSLAFFRIAQDFIGLVDLLKFLFGLLFILGDVGMIFSGQLAEGTADLVLLRSLWNA